MNDNKRFFHSQKMIRKSFLFVNGIEVSSAAIWRQKIEIEWDNVMVYDAQ